MINYELKDYEIESIVNGFSALHFDKLKMESGDSIKIYIKNNSKNIINILDINTIDGTIDIVAEDGTNVNLECKKYRIA